MSKNKEKTKMKKWEKIFIIISILFILGCIGFYGYRLIKYYKVFNPKEVDSNGLLSIEIPKNSTLVTEGDGLYRLNGSYVFRGNVDNNYIMYSGLLFRIVKINYGSSTELILDSKINTLSFGENTTYMNSDINNYLNNVFIKAINKDKLDKITICTEKKKDISDDKCKKKSDVYSTILDSNTFLSTVTTDTYLNNNSDLLYLRDTISAEKSNVIANGSQISYVDGTEYYDIKPMISLNYDTKLISGTGTKDDPYIVDNVSSNLGKKIDLGGYSWVVIKENKNILTLALDGTLNSLKPFGEAFDTSDENSIAYYLNNEFYNSLDFKDDIIETTWNIGTYTTSYKDIESQTIKAKVGLLSISDFKFNEYDSPYLLLNKASDDEVYIMDKSMYKVDKNLSKSVRPVINIKSTGTMEVK